MLRPWLFVGFTGHRKLEHPERVASSVREVFRRLEERTRAPLAAVSSAASGADTLFAVAAAERNLPWTALLPFPVDEFRKDFADDPAAWVQVEQLLANAVRTVVEPSTEVRSDAYLEAGVRTVDESDVVVAVWNGEPAAGRGGTGDVIDYIRSQDKPLIWIHPDTGAITEERCEKLPVEPPSPAGATKRDERIALDEAFQHHNDAAKALRPRALNINLSLVYMHQLSAAITLTVLVWSNQAWLQAPGGYIKLGILGAAFVLPWFLRRAHDDWLSHRLHAEMMRSARTVWKLPDPESIFPALRLPVEDRRQRGLLLSRLLSPVPRIDLPTARREYETERISAQHAYFQQQAAKAAHQQRWLTRFAMGCTAVAIVTGVLPMLGLVTSEMELYRPLRLMGWVLPLATTALLSTVAAKDLARRAARFRELASFLDRSRGQLELARTWSRFTRLVIDVERTLLLEIWEWYSLARFSPKR